MAIIYLIRNTINQKVYIGQTTTTLNKRFLRHIYEAKQGSNMVICRAIREYGAVNFQAEILFEGEVSQSELDNLERRFIDDFNSHVTKNGYNVAVGGHGGCLTHDFGERVSKGKLAAKTKRPDQSLRMKTRSQEQILLAASAGGKAIKGIAKKGEHGKKGSPTHPKAGLYEVKSPEGKQYFVKNLSEFCRQHDLNKYSMIQCASPKYSQTTHKGGWTCKKLTCI